VLVNPDKTIKLWKVFDKSIRIVTENNMGDANADIKPFDSERVAKGKKSILDSSLLGLPRMTYHDSITAAIPRKIYQNAHGYHINSISINSDDETFISADDLRINLWNFQIPDQSFSNIL
jgi:serine/threonine-protein phosphatase 2A regulatory subunit B